MKEKFLFHKRYSQIHDLLKLADPALATEYLITVIEYKLGDTITTKNEKLKELVKEMIEEEREEDLTL